MLPPSALYVFLKTYSLKDRMVRAVRAESGKEEDRENLFPLLAHSLNAHNQPGLGLVTARNQELHPGLWPGTGSHARGSGLCLPGEGTRAESKAEQLGREWHSELQHKCISASLENLLVPYLFAHEQSCILHNWGIPFLNIKFLLKGWFLSETYLSFPKPKTFMAPPS